MNPDPPIAPSVVSVMVVHEPGEWFDETLESLASQDYPNLRTLFLVTPVDDDEAADISSRILAVLPDAFVRELGGNVGYGAAANEVLRLVEGDNGFFLLCHDDVALQPDVVRTMVAELFRSNAGIVGPKLTDWDRPRMLQHVGLGLDRFGEVDPIVEPDEVDQEQHDAVRDVFVLPSACLLVRADLFRALGGFDPAVTFHGEDVELCWRAHLTGARVILAPDASVRHRERLVERRPDLGHRTLRSRHRMRAVATLTGSGRLLLRSVELVVLTLVELVVGLFTGRFGEALSSFRALVGLFPRTGAIAQRRRTIRGQRVVPEREVLELQNRGSSRLTSYLRGKETTTFVGSDTTVRRWREASFGPLLAWFLVLLAIVVGSRTFIREGVPPVGEFLPFPESPSQLLTDFRSSFDNRSFGSTVAVPTGWAVIAISSVVTLFRMSLLLTVSIVGLYVVGAIGAWRLATVFPQTRARIAAMVVYVATPVVPGILSRGDWSALVWYAALPWLVHLVAKAAGLAAADPESAATDVPDGIAPISMQFRVRSWAFASLVLALAAAFVPAVIALWAIVGAILALATLVAGGSWRVALWLAGSTAVSVVVAIVLNVPWAFEWTWADVVGAQPAGSTGRSVVDMLTLAPDSDRFAVLAICLYLPVFAAVAITRAWRLTWSVRAAGLVLGFGALSVFAARGAIDVLTPAPSLLAVPIALGLALAAACITGGFDFDVLSRGFGWRQPLGVLANVAIVIGLVPAVLSIGNGAWDAPTTPISRLLATQLPEDPAAGDYRVLYLGDSRVLPVPGREYRDGIAFAVVDSGELDFTDRFFVSVTGGDDAVVRALDLIADGSTLRAGRLLAPLGIRYIVIPETDGVQSTVDDPIPVPEGLVGALQNQLDIGALYGPPSLELFVNQSWIPAGAQLSGPTAAASLLAGEDALVRADLSDAVPSMVGVDRDLDVANEVAPGVVHIAIPFDERLSLDVGGTTIEPRRGFGVTTAFDIAAPGVGAVAYEEVPSRSVWLVVALALWALVLAVGAGARAPFGRRRSAAIHDETLIDLSDDPTLSHVVVDGPGAGVFGEVLAAPTWEVRDEGFEIAPDAHSAEHTGWGDDDVTTDGDVVRDDEPVDLAGLANDGDEPSIANDDVGDLDPPAARPDRRTDS